MLQQFHQLKLQTYIFNMKSTGSSISGPQTAGNYRQYEPIRFLHAIRKDKRPNLSDGIVCLPSGSHVLLQGHRLIMRLLVVAGPFFLWAGSKQTSKLRYEKVGGKSSEMHRESSLIGLESAFGQRISPQALFVEMWLAADGVRLLLSQLRAICWVAQ
jgi:hypothetical protein